ncbi:DUF4335 domain-containing protein [Iningainema tapete]|uniref:DUF4335 domain-containing protein n=1 Tax=Iningainema tapete BLCC-T55 TaxID=2748662 RepID=A0A8J6XTZ0_9CYAN|nr:DUF4335 domain-containing protein [Iningainema tapete]MBD2777561.1 DUF4335 domain-containing protein [Iningainema tapete BLCC-T55]
MPVSNYVIRRYTPPTCTLEILAQSSALSRWMGKSVLKQLRFELRFDAPQTQPEQRVAIRGDRDQLEALCTVVTNYVQELLQKPPDNFGAMFAETQQQTITIDEATRDADTTTVSNPLKPYNNQKLGSDISLQPSDSLKHKLFLGNLANHVSGPVIQLTLLQLFDLATALDEYSADVLALPNLETSTAPKLSTWTSVAAVLVLGVALAPVTWQYANRTRQQVAKKSTTRSEQIALKPSPSPNLQSTPIPALTPPDTLPSIPQLPLSTTNLPTPTPTPTANISSPPPTLATLPKSSVSPIIRSSPQSAISLPTLQKTPQSTQIPSLDSKSPSLKNTTPLPSSQTTLTVPELSTKIPTGIPTTPSTALKIPSPQINLQPNLRQNTTGFIAKNSSGSVPETTSIKSPNSLSTTSSVTSTLPTTPSLNTLPEPNKDSSSSVTGTELIAKLRETRKTPTEVATGTLFDTAQVAEARDFLKKRWQPPNQLKQAIEYSLVVGVDGSIERIFPIGKSARDYIDRTGMPLIGERFVSPNRNGQAVKIRAVFSPDGAVQTFPEKD